MNTAVADGTSGDEGENGGLFTGAHGCSWVFTRVFTGIHGFAQRVLAILRDTARACP